MTTQTEAIEAALSGNVRTRAAIAARALRALARDENDTEQVFLLGISVNAHKFPDLLARFCVDESGARLLEEQPSIDTAHVDFDTLRQLPDGTLGREYARFLDDNALDPDLFQPPPGLPPLPTFVTKRIRQTHDLWHVLTGFATDVPGEVGLQMFSYRQLRMPSSLFIVALGILRWGWREPRIFSLIRRGGRLGRSAAYLPTIRWEDHWERGVDELREELGLAA